MNAIENLRKHLTGTNDNQVEPPSNGLKNSTETLSPNNGRPISLNNLTASEGNAQNSNEGNPSLSSSPPLEGQKRPLEDKIEPLPSKKRLLSKNISSILHCEQKEEIVKNEPEEIKVEKDEAKGSLRPGRYLFPNADHFFKIIISLTISLKLISLKAQNAQNSNGFFCLRISLTFPFLRLQKFHPINAKISSLQIVTKKSP